MNKDVGFRFALPNLRNLAKLYTKNVFKVHGLKLFKTYLIPAIVTLIFGLVLGMSLWYMQRDVRALEYNLTESEIFPIGKRVGRFFVIEIKNTGNKEIQNATFRIAFSTGHIETAKFSNNDLVKKPCSLVDTVLAVKHKEVYSS